MKQFYADFESIIVFTLSLDFHQNELACVHCSKRNQFVSHGIIYKQRSSTVREKVGKRIFCSNRYGRQGCGRTFQLYIAKEIPTFHYGTAHLFVFIASLLAHHCVEKAYFTATGQSAFRHAWRWLERLVKQMGTYRAFLKSRPATTSPLFQHNARRFQILLPTLWQLSVHFTSNLCSNYQLLSQKAFV